MNSGPFKQYIMGKVLVYNSPKRFCKSDHIFNENNEGTVRMMLHEIGRQAQLENEKVLVTEFLNY